VRIGVLALQGDWAAHADVLRTIGATASEVRSAEDLARVDALVLPGGESTSMLTLMESEKLAGRIADRVRAGMPVLATCAGVILLARGTKPSQSSMGLLNIDVERNAYGRQVHSRVTEVKLDRELGSPETIEGVFIRAPKIVRTGTEVSVLGTCGADPVLVRQDRIIAATFHPELTDDRRVHRLLVDMEADDGR
jgi:5'-phosphate synthase pdxT subunit